MKKISISALVRAILVVATFFTLAPQTSAQMAPTDTLRIYSKNGKTFNHPISEIDSVTFKKPLRELPENVTAVDLGLSVKWANLNLGAKRAEDFGGFYAWGEIVEKDEYTMDNYAYYDPNKINACITIGEDIKSTKYDVAHMTWGEGWRMPSESESEELMTKCTWTLTNRNGVAGYKVTGPNGNSIFLPAGGTKDDSDHRHVGEYGGYWTSTYTYPTNITLTQCARLLYFYDGKIKMTDGFRCNGHNIRPVYP